MVTRYCEIVRKKLPDFTFDDKQELLRLLIDKVIVKGRRAIIQGVIPIENTLNDSQSFIGSNSGVGRNFSGRGSGRFIGLPSILYNCWAS